MIYQSWQSFWSSEAGDQAFRLCVLLATVLLVLVSLPRGRNR